MTTSIQTQTLSLDEFVERYGDEGLFEFVDGEVIPVAPQAAGSGYLGGRFYRMLSAHVDDRQLGVVFIETPFVLTLGRSRWVTGSRVPDVMFYTAERFRQFQADYPDWESIPVVGAPDFVAEIISPTDRYSEVSAKVRRYLADGVALVWVMDQAEKTIQAHQPGSGQIMTYSGDSTISGHPVVADFALALTALFVPPLHTS